MGCARSYTGLGVSMRRTSPHWLIGSTFSSTAVCWLTCTRSVIPLGSRHSSAPSISRKAGWRSRFGRSASSAARSATPQVMRRRVLPASKAGGKLAASVGLSSTRAPLRVVNARPLASPVRPKSRMNLALWFRSSTPNSSFSIPVILIIRRLFTVQSPEFGRKTCPTQSSACC